MTDQPHSLPDAMPGEAAEARENAKTSTRSGGQAGRSVRVLVIDDEPEIRRAILAGLTSADFVGEWVPTGGQGIEMVARWHPDIVILDLALPDMDGLEVCRSLRTWTPVPIIVLSVRASDSDKITVLEAGADDYLTKPFSMGELITRVRVALRHVGAGAGRVEARIQVDGLVLDIARRVVSVDGTEMHLTPTEYEVLKYLALNAGKVVTHRTLLRAVWGPEYEDAAHYLRVFINQLRRKLEPNPSRPHYLLTEPGIGYRLRTPE